MAIFQAIAILLCSVLLVSGSDLAPFIVWSTEQSVSQLNPRSTNDDIVSTLGSSEASTIVVFAFDKLSFDDIVVYGIDDGAVSNIQSSMDSAPFNYWNGLSPMSEGWVLDLADKLGTTPNFVPESEVYNIDPINSIYIFRLSSFNSFEANDAIIGRIMKSVKDSSGDSYLAICTAISKVSRFPHRSVRAAPEVQADGVEVTTSPNSVNPSCPIGGQLNYTTYNNDTVTACMMFCLSSPISFLPDTNNTNGTCTLSMPSKIAYNCSQSNGTMEDNDDVISQEYGKQYPSVTVSYSVLKTTNNASALNNCSNQFWEKFIEPPEGPDAEDAEPRLDVMLTFFFPRNFTYNESHVHSNWAVMISSVYKQSWVNTALQGPGDDKDVPTEVLSDRVLLVRKTPPGLYQNFLIPEGNSYACSAPAYSMYVHADFSVENDTLKILGYVMENGTSQLSLTSLQVQAYNVSNTAGGFSSADNCIGFFTEASWMGILSMSVLAIIFYLAILCTFSLKTLDQFEDPRGETISVEKLH